MMKKLSALLGMLIFVYGSLAAEPPLNLDQCIKLALKNNTDILNAEAERRTANSQKTIARAGFMPSVSSWLGYSYSEVGPSSQTYLDPFTGIEREIRPYTSISKNFSSGFNLDQTFYYGGYNIANYQKSRYDAKAADYALEDTRQEIIYRVEEDYLELLKQKHLLEVYRETIKISEEELKKAQSMEQIGAAPHGDVLKARVMFESDKMALIEAENNLEVARANLNHRLGLDVNRDTEVEEISLETRWELSYEDAEKIALESHPVLKQSNSMLRSAEKNIRMNKARYLPSLTGRINYSWNNEEFNRISDMFDEDYNWSASVSLGIPLFEGFSRPANISIAKVGYRNLQDQNLQVKRDVMLGVKVAYLGLMQAKKQIVVAQERVISAEEDLKQSTARYQLGAGTMLEKINAQVMLTTAKVQKIQAEYDYRLAQSLLKRTIGRL